MVGQARRHRRCTRSPHLRRAAAVGWDRFGERLAKAGVRQHEIVIDLEQHQLILQARFALAERVDPAPDRRHPLADVEVESFHKGGVDGPATRRQDLLDGQPGAEHHAVFDPHDAPAPVRLHHLRIEQLGQRHPPRLGQGASAPGAVRGASTEPKWVSKAVA